MELRLSGPAVRAGKGGVPLRDASRRNAERHDEDLREVVDRQARFAVAWRNRVNRRGILPRRGGRGHRSTLVNLLKRLGSPS